jgi:hypothetical protein
MRRSSPREPRRGAVLGLQFWEFSQWSMGNKACHSTDSIQSNSRKSDSATVSAPPWQVFLRDTGRPFQQHGWWGSTAHQVGPVASLRGKGCAKLLRNSAEHVAFRCRSPQHSAEHRRISMPSIARFDSERRNTADGSRPTRHRAGTAVDLWTTRVLTMPTMPIDTSCRVVTDFPAARLANCSRLSAVRFVTLDVRQPEAFGRTIRHPDCNLVISP